MSENELRIGNYVMDRGGKVLRIDGWESPTKIFQNIGAYKIPGIEKYINLHPLTEEIEHLQPIPLTEEWLLNFGFENGGYDYLFWYKEEFEFSGINWADKDIPEYHFLVFELKNDKYIKIYYLHQLQNLYFALTGEELTLKNI